MLMDGQKKGYWRGGRCHKEEVGKDIFISVETSGNSEATGKRATRSGGVETHVIKIGCGEELTG